MKLHYLSCHSVLEYVIQYVLCFANVVVDRLLQSLNGIDITLGILRANILTTSWDTKDVVFQCQIGEWNGEKKYQNLVWDVFLGTKGKSGVKKSYKNSGGHEIILSVLKIPTGRAESTKKFGASDVRESIYNLRESYERGIKYVLCVAQKRNFMLTILNHLLITPSYVTNQVTQDCFVLSVTGGHPILGARLGRGWCLGENTLS